MVSAEAEAKWACTWARAPRPGLCAACPLRILAFSLSAFGICLDPALPRDLGPWCDGTGVWCSYQDGVFGEQGVECSARPS